MHNSKKLGTILGGLAIVMLASAVPAHAEGSWSSSMNGVRTGFDSRTWTDNNSDNVSTRIALSGCSNGGTGAPVTNTQLQLTRQTAWYQPDENRGRYTFHCSSSDANAFGRQPAGNYHFTVTRIQGSTTGFYLSVRSVAVQY
ncbi:hypothetical protein [Streptomyces bohaiensis]|uniref:Uncharacterized protein n=1 Tax=Streptomyces bohaiensis TaxID=1431344 RepID=A0ABX1CBZ0_9ACTN|nr:hypothetical protein [Streptomyces bohaiensis]NJQ14722.1 hypothetical protein [Streptomyces bohaiensis]